jgi:outer membrane protein OmpA-like peptidoglycan-associated protein/tetratricopeptide (TPR) repeat protein
MSFRLLLLLTLFCCATAPLVAQAKTGPAAARVTFSKGTQLLLAGKHKKAAKLFEEAINQDSTLTAASRFLGIAEERQGHYVAAALAYQRVIDRDPYSSRLLYYQLAKVYYRMSRPKLAMHYLLKFEELQEEDLGEFGRNGEAEAREEEEALATLDDDIRSASITQDSSQFINVTKIVNLGPPVNTIRADYFPFISNDKLSMIYTRQGELRDEDLIRGRRPDTETKFATSRFGSINTTVKAEGMMTFVRDGERVFFTQCNDDEERGYCKIYSGWLIGGRLEDVEKLPDFIMASSWVSQPAISCDGQQLFFASIRPGGVGGSDIYMCRKNSEGSWTEPKNLGTGVNTPQNEEGPFLSNDGRTLYFASEGHANLGDQDIFMSFWDEKAKRFTRAMNLGPPVNGPHRELGFHLTSDGKTGYVASNRPGGVGDLDIYRFELSDRLSSRPVTYVSGYVTDSLTGEPIIDHAIPVTGGNTYYTNYEGRFFICAPSSAPLPLTVTHPDYNPYSRDFAIPPWENLKPYRIDLLLSTDAAPAPPPPEPEPEPEPEIPVDNVRWKPRIVPREITVRFDFDDASLTSVQIETINKFVEEIKDKNIIKVTILGFSDEVGDDGNNIRLSQNRAKAVGIHLQTAGIKANEVKIIGMGELPGVTERALNRKVEVAVLYREMVEIR